MTPRHYVDLHLHSTHSDGGDTPTRVVERAKEAELSAIALTDHDTLSGVPEAQEAGDRYGIQVLSGVEISSRWGKHEVHILGLGVALDCEALNTALDDQAAQRDRRAADMVEKLQALDVPITLEAVQAKAADGVIGRIHIAQAVLEAGSSRTVQDAFDKYIKAGRPAYVPKKMLSAADSVDLIHAAKGLAFVAHPGLGKLHRVLDSLLAIPFDGIEVHHSRHSPGLSGELKNVAHEKGLMITGGSDCHGTIKGEEPLMGKVQVPWTVYETITAKLATL